MIAWLIARGVPASIVRPALIALAVLALGLVWRCSVDSGVRSQEAAQRAANAEQARKADERAATQQRADDARNGAERRALEGTADYAPTPLSDRDRAFLRCVRMQQRARAEQKPAPAC